MADPAKRDVSRLLNTSTIEVRDDLDDKLERCYKTIFNAISKLNEKDAIEWLQSHVNKSPAQHEEVQMALLFSILTEPETGPKCYRDLSLVARDGMMLALTRTNQIIHEKWLKLRESSKGQIVWLAAQIVKNGVAGADSVCQSLIRQMAGGDVSNKNIWLVERMLDIFTENRAWLDKCPGLLSVAVFTYLRLILDHGAQSLLSLRKREVDFCVSRLRDKFADCMVIGRDLVRLLQYVARIPEFERLWRDILHNPTSLCPTFTGIAQLMGVRTSRKYLLCRMTPDMENKVNFLTSKVKFGQHKRYQDWFQRQYLSTPESQSLRPDLIRFICAVVHPSNEVLCSDIIPRWAVIGWLLTTCTSNVAASNAKLSLFYDWLAFDPEKDSIMNIEPAILVMYHSMRPHPAITATLLDFLCRIMGNFYPPLNARVKQGVYTSLRTILEKRVLQSLSPLFDNNKLDKELRSMIKESFGEFCSPDVQKEEPNGKDMIDLIEETSVMDHNASGGSSAAIEAQFSDDEDDVTTPVTPTGDTKIEIPIKISSLKPPEPYETMNVSEYIEMLDGEMRNVLEQMRLEKDSSNQCEITDSLVQLIIQEELFDLEMAETVALCLCNILAGGFNSPVFPTEVDEESLEDSIGLPLFVLFRNLTQTHEDDPSRQPLLLLLSEMYKKQGKIGYYLLYFLKVASNNNLKCAKVNDERMLTYRDLCKHLETRDLESCLMKDCSLCAENDVRLLAYILPDVYTQFPNIAIGNTELLHMIVSTIDGTQLQDLICQILQGHLKMFRKDSFLAVLNASLEWETMEQYFLWQLIAAHDIPVEHILPILPKLEFSHHAEALTCILIQLKQEQKGPTAELVRTILCRECKRVDFFVVSIIKYWAENYEDRLSDFILAHVQKNSNTPNRKRQRQQQMMNNKNENPSLEQILSHMDHFRQTCKNISLLSNASIQQALILISAAIPESSKAKYSDLLALAEDLDDLKTTRTLRGGRKTTSSLPTSPKGSKSKKTADSSTSSDSSSDEEEIVRPKAKKRKTNSLPLDDSD